MWHLAHVLARKPSQKPSMLRLTLFQQAKQKINIPLVAIGGITLQNAPLAIAAGADAIAVITSLFDAMDVTAASQQFTQLFESA